jgi:hypothetical protein
MSSATSSCGIRVNNQHIISSPSKIWLGPYNVLAQRNIDVRVEHIVMLQTSDTFHMDRLKPFFGSMKEAVALADIASINYFTGNPHLCKSISLETF